MGPHCIRPRCDPPHRCPLPHVRPIPFLPPLMEDEPLPNNSVPLSYPLAMHQPHRLNHFDTQRLMTSSASALFALHADDMNANSVDSGHSTGSSVAQVSTFEPPGGKRPPKCTLLNQPDLLYSQFNAHNQLPPNMNPYLPGEFLLLIPYS